MTKNSSIVKSFVINDNGNVLVTLYFSNFKNARLFYSNNFKRLAAAFLCDYIKIFIYDNDFTYIIDRSNFNEK